MNRSDTIIGLLQNEGLFTEFIIDMSLAETQFECSRKSRERFWKRQDTGRSTPGYKWSTRHAECLPIMTERVDQHRDAVYN